MFKAWHKSKMFLHGQSTQTLRVDNLYFFLPYVHHSFLKLERILTLMIRKEKHICLKSAFDLKNYGFWKCAFNKKIVHVYMIEV